MMIQCGVSRLCSLPRRFTMAVRFLMWLVWLVLVVLRYLRYAHVSCDGAYDPAELRCAPESLLPPGGGQGTAVISWKRNSHLRPSCYRGRAQIPTHFWLLLLAGDVERNPGPVRYPCTTCAKAVRTNQCGILCDGCEEWTHAKCCGIDVSEYERLGASPNEEWLCPGCVRAELPFANASCAWSVSEDNDNDEGLSSSGSECAPNGISVPLDPCHLEKNSPVFCHLNAQSLLPKVDDVRDFLLNVRRPMILGVSESWLDSTIPDGVVDVEGYNMSRRDRGTRGGGVVVYVPTQCRSWRRQDLEDDQIEAVWIEIRLREEASPLLLCNVYRPPNTSQSFMDAFSCLIEKASRESKHIVLMGDLNCNLMLPSAPSKQLLDVTCEFNLTQLISEPTRITSTSQTLLDVLFTTCPEMFCASGATPLTGSVQLQLCNWGYCTLLPCRATEFKGHHTANRPSSHC